MNDEIPKNNKYSLAIDIKGLPELIHIFSQLNLKLEKIMADLTALTAAVAKDTEVDQSAITLLKGLKAALDAAGTDPVKLKELSDQIGSNTDALAAAVAENTPAQ